MTLLARCDQQDSNANATVDGTVASEYDPHVSDNPEQVAKKRKTTPKLRFTQEGKRLHVSEFAKRLGVTEREVYRRMQRGTLVPVKRDARGGAWFDEGQLREYHRPIHHTTRPFKVPRFEGHVSSRVFARLRAGAPLRDIVEAEQVSPEVVRALAAEWAALDDGAIYVTSDEVARIAEITQRPIADEKELVAAVSSALVYSCRRCKNPQDRNAVLCDSCHSLTITETADSVRDKTRDKTNAAAAREITALVARVDAERNARILAERRLMALEKKFSLAHGSDPADTREDALDDDTRDRLARLVSDLHDSLEHEQPAAVPTKSNGHASNGASHEPIDEDEDP